MACAKTGYAHGKTTIYVLVITMDSNGFQMDTRWPAWYEKQRTLRISTIGRKTGKRHEVTVEFAVGGDGRLFITTRDKRRDWVRNVTKNPSVDVTIGGVTQKMKVFPVKMDSEKQHVRDLYTKKYPLVRLSRLFASSKGSALSEAFELQPQ